MQWIPSYQVPAPSEGKAPTSGSGIQAEKSPSSMTTENQPAKQSSQPHTTDQSGRVKVWCRGHGHGRHGLFLTPNGAEWRSGAVACSLSSTLETALIPQRFYLSPTACAGILRRAEKRGKALPAVLRQALEAVACPAS